MALDPRAFPILYVDSDAVCVDAFRGALREGFTVNVASSGADALRGLASAEIAVLVVEPSLPDMSGLEVLEHARLMQPEAIRVLSAVQLRPEVAEQAINRGCMSRYLAKPWQAESLRQWLVRELETRIRERDAHVMMMGLWQAGQAAAATTIYEELVHELSNPLGALEINASLVNDLLRGLTDGAIAAEERRDSVQMAIEAHDDSLAAIEQMKRLVSRMREGTRARARQQGRCDAGQTIEAVLRVVRAEVEKVARLEVCVDSSPTLLIDGVALGQIVLNLVLNAAQAVSSRSRASNRIQVLAVSQQEQFLISVRDNGPGIPPELAQRIFEPFFTTKEKAAGLGLAICRELVNRAHGVLTMETPPGGGVCFVFSLPVAKLTS